MSNFRKDNRVFSFPRYDRINFEAAGAGVAHPLDIQMTGKEPLLIKVGPVDCSIGYTNNGPWIDLYAGTSITYELGHPFRGDLFFKCDSSGGLSTVDIKFMIGGYVNVQE